MSIFIVHVTKQINKLDYFEETLNILVGLLFYIQLPQGTISITVILLHDWTSDF